MMDELLSGLTSSMFDDSDHGISPIKSRRASQAVRSPLKPVQALPILPNVIISAPAYITPPVRLPNDLNTKVEPETRSVSPLEKDRDSSKTMVDYDDYFLDFDVNDMSAFDDDLLNIDNVPPKVSCWPQCFVSCS